MATGNQSVSVRLGDFTLSPRVLLISLLALCIGVSGAFVALALLRLIGIFTNLFFFQRWGTNLVSPAGNHLGPFVVLVPVIGALIIGLLARFGSERIRGHGIPEAIEAILINGSQMQPRVAILKPLASAISIGSGGPFGAEGPIIMTGGAVGSIIAQCLHLTSTERKTLLVAGAAAGMSAIFATPVAAVLLAVELLLFEWKPRSLIPVALASAAAGVMRQYLIGQGPLFPVPLHPLFVSPIEILSCVLVGLLAGGLAILLTLAVYASEDAFKRLPIHWMWWPVLGGIVIGLGGLICPQALGVGYDVIGSFLQGNVPFTLLLSILLVKGIIWSVSLGSGTSGGVVAPLLIMGAALGGLEALFLPQIGPGFWPLISMAAVLASTMRSPLTGVVFALELTHDVNSLLPLLVACVIGYGLSVLVMRRSILTEKVSRRGYHLTSEYAIDPLETMLVREIARVADITFSREMSQAEIKQTLTNAHDQRGQYLYPVLDTDQRLTGVLTRRSLHCLLQQAELPEQDLSLEPFITSIPVVCYPDEPLRIVVHRMAETHLTSLPVVERHLPHRLLGMVALPDLLNARVRNQQEERNRERMLRLRPFFPLRQPSHPGSK